MLLLLLFFTFRTIRHHFLLGWRLKSITQNRTLRRAKKKHTKIQFNNANFSATVSLCIHRPHSKYQFQTFYAHLSEIERSFFLSPLLSKTIKIALCILFQSQTKPLAAAATKAAAAALIIYSKLQQFSGPRKQMATQKKTEKRAKQIMFCNDDIFPVIVEICEHKLRSRA